MSEKKSIKDKIYEDVFNFIDEKEEENYNSLSRIKKIFWSNDDRMELKSIAKERVRLFLDKIVDERVISRLEKFIPKIEPEVLLNNLREIIKSIKEKNEPKNEWLVKRLEKTELLLDDKLISLSKENIIKLIGYTGSIFCQEITNRKVTGYINREVQQLAEIIVMFPCFENFRDLAGGYSYVVRNEMYLSKQDISLIHRYTERAMENLDAQFVKEESVVSHKEKNSYLKIKDGDIFSIVKMEMNSLCRENELLNLVRDIQVELNNDFRQTGATYLKRIYDAKDDLSQIAKLVFEENNTSVMSYGRKIKTITRFLKNIYLQTTFEEYKGIFYENPVIHENYKFILLSDVINRQKYRTDLLNELSDEQLMAIRKQDASKYNSEFSGELREFQNLAQEIREKRISDIEIARFQNGENTLNFTSQDIKMFSVDIENLSVLLRNKLDKEKIKMVNNKNYSLSTNTGDGRCELILKGSYAQSLNDEEVLELFIEIIHECNGTRKNIVEPLIRSKEIKYRIEINESDRKIEKIVRGSRKKV